MWVRICLKKKIIFLKWHEGGSSWSKTQVPSTGPGIIPPVLHIWALSPALAHPLQLRKDRRLSRTTDGNLLSKTKSVLVKSQRNIYLIKQFRYWWSFQSVMIRESRDAWPTHTAWIWSLGTVAPIKPAKMRLASSDRGAANDLHVTVFTASLYNLKAMQRGEMSA